MTTNNDERVTVWANVYEKDMFLWPTEEQANAVNADWVAPRLRLAKCRELREGETIVTREMREKIQHFTGSMWADETRTAAGMILDILDGKDGQ